MNITKRQLRKIINEVTGPHPSTPVDTSPGPYRDHFNVTDVDNGRSIQTSIYTNYGMVTVSFGNSFVLHIDAASAQELGAAIQEAGLQLGDLEAGRNPGGSIG